MPSPLPEIPLPFQDMVWWILGDDGRTPKPVGMEEGMAWAAEHGTVRVALHEDGTVFVSTVFIPKMGRPGQEPPLFESLYFAPGMDEERTRSWRTWDEAQAGHDALVAEHASPSPSLH